LTTRGIINAMHPQPWLAVLLIVTASAALARAEPTQTEPKQERTCNFEVKARGVSGYATVTLEGKAVTGVDILVHQRGRYQHGFSCMIDVSRTDGQSKWSDEGDATLIVNPHPLNPDESDRLKVTVGQHVSIDLEESKTTYRCGAGAELPRVIVIPAGRKACRVWLPER